MKLTFGKFKGRTLQSLLNTPEGIAYVRWMATWTRIPRRWSAHAKEALRKAGL